MSPEQIFSAANSMALVSWVLMVTFPRRRWVIDTLVRTIAPLLFAALYVALLAAMLSGSGGSFSTLSGVAALFANPWLLLAGWVHYLAFDLLIGSWEVRDAQARGIPHILVVPCLVLTFLFGPAGWLLYRLVRWTTVRSRAEGPNASA